MMCVHRFNRSVEFNQNIDRMKMFSDLNKIKSSKRFLSRSIGNRQFGKNSSFLDNDVRHPSKRIRLVNTVKTHVIV